MENIRSLFSDICNCTVCFPGALSAGYAHPDPLHGQPNEPWLGDLKRSSVHIVGLEPTCLDESHGELTLARRATLQGVSAYQRLLEEALDHEDLLDKTLRKIHKLQHLVGPGASFAVFNTVRCRRERSLDNKASQKVLDQCSEKWLSATLNTGSPKVVILHAVAAQRAILKEYRNHLPHTIDAGALLCVHPEYHRGFKLTAPLDPATGQRVGFSLVLLPHFVWVSNALMERAADYVREMLSYERQTRQSGAWLWDVEPL